MKQLNEKRYRVKEQHHELYKIIDYKTGRECMAQVSGKYVYQVLDRKEYPAVGDWVVLEAADILENDQNIHMITDLLPRNSLLQRVSAGRSGQVQIIAANIDILFLCMSVNENFNLRRMERYLAVANGCGIQPVVVLTKTDLCDNPYEYMELVKRDNMELEVILSTMDNSSGVEAVRALIGSDSTVAFVGSSGVGKSTLINLLMEDEIMATSEIRLDDGRGHHTTTHRELLRLKNGGTVIDTPGMRELQMDEADTESTFDEIEQLIASCKFSNCTHTKEPGCAVKAAIEQGILDEKRFKSYQKLLREEENRRIRKQMKVPKKYRGKVLK